jgi:hypothetical protein
MYLDRSQPEECVMKRMQWTSVAWGIVVFALLGLGALGARLVRAEREQAHALVMEGRGALERGDKSVAHLDFVRASLLAPRAEFVRAALADVPSVSPRTAVERAVSSLAPREWAFLLVAFGWGAGLTSAVMIASSSKLVRARWLVALTALFVASGVAFARSTSESRRVAVVTRSEGLLISPYDGAGAAAELAPGTVVRMAGNYGRYARIESGETSGWVPSSALRAVGPG